MMGEFFVWSAGWWVGEERDIILVVWLRLREGCETFRPRDRSEFFSGFNLFSVRGP